MHTLWKWIVKSIGTLDSLIICDSFIVGFKIWHLYKLLLVKFWYNATYEGTIDQYYQYHVFSLVTAKNSPNCQLKHCRLCTG